MELEEWMNWIRKSIFSFILGFIITLILGTILAVIFADATEQFFVMMGVLILFAYAYFMM